MGKKRLSVNGAIVLGMSLGSMLMFAAPETETEISEEQTQQQEVFDPAQVEDQVFLSAMTH